MIKDYTPIEEYFQKLISQYQSTKEKVNLNLLYGTEFLEWLEITQKENLKIYQKFLEDKYPKLTNCDIVELNKGVNDSLTSDNIERITPYAQTFPGELNIRPAVYIPTGQFKNYLDTEETEFVKNKYLITHNPYCYADVTSFKIIFKTGTPGLIGVYGSVDDKDRKLKVGQISSLREELKNIGLTDLSYDEETSFNTYMAVLSTKPKIRNLKRRINSK